jgi:hypothetical protein
MNTLERGAISRRDLIWLLGVATGAATLGCRSGRHGRTFAEQTVESVSDTVEGLLTAERDLPGIVSGQMIAATAFAGRSEADSRLLAGRLYYDAVTVANGQSGASDSSGTRFSSANIRRILSEPLPAERFQRQYFDGQLRDTQARMVDDPTFARKINEYSGTSTGRAACRCTINGEDAGCWQCLIIIVIIIIIIL